MNSDRFPAMPPKGITNEQLFSLLQRMDAKQSMMLVQQNEHKKRFDQFEIDTQDLLAAWRTLDGLYRFLKYVAAAAAAIGVIYLAIANGLEEIRKWLERS